MYVYPHNNVCTCTKFHNGAKLAIGWDETEQSAPIMMTSVMVLDELVT